MTALVIDTNVTVVANGQNEQAGYSCQCGCIEALENAREQLVLIDEDFEILDEYRRHLSHSGQPGVGDAFFKWLWENQSNPDHCRKVQINPDSTDPGSFEEFPKDQDLADFDYDDRKFVAVASASKLAARILNASDTDWWLAREALRRHGLDVEFLCPSLMPQE